MLSCKLIYIEWDWLVWFTYVILFCRYYVLLFTIMKEWVLIAHCGLLPNEICCDNCPYNSRRTVLMNSMNSRMYLRQRPSTEVITSGDIYWST